jgi:hypothetical protein
MRRGVGAVGDLKDGAGRTALVGTADAGEGWTGAGTESEARGISGSEGTAGAGAREFPAGGALGPEAFARGSLVTRVFMGSSRWDFKGAHSW